MNSHMDTTDASKAAIPPTLTDYAEAFYALDQSIGRLQRMTDAVQYLSALASETAESQKPPIYKDPMIGIVEVVAYEAHQIAKETEKLYLASFNDLVGRENGELCGRLS